MAASKEIIVSRFFTYDVFLSFRGKDTRTHFTDHLYSALIQAGFHTFRDDDEIGRGENIEVELQKAIRESKISVIVFSKDYASSTWCLDELLMIMNKRKGGNHVVLPIFYDVTPSQVRRQTGDFASSFSKHIEHFKEEIDKINQWRAALKDAADLSGMELNGGYESRFIQDVVREIRKKLHPGKLYLTPHLVGIDFRVKEINSWLRDEAHEASIAIIYGLGGVGKTTIAKILYNENLERYESSSFISNVRDSSKDHNCWIRLQNQLLSDILKGNIHEVHNKDDGIAKIRNAICCKSVLIILDDVDESNQLDMLLGKQKLELLLGSKIILTTRNKCLLKTNHVHEKFEVNVLDEKDSLELFNWHAFGKNYPTDNYLKCSVEVVKWCGGLPLALEVLGSSLLDENIDVWEDTLQKLHVIPDSEIQQILKISYDSLKDDDVQNLFLTIACFFLGFPIDFATPILKGCGFYTSVGIKKLVDRCLLSVDKKNSTLCMHKLLVKMGREVVRRESINDPGRRSILWQMDAVTVLQDRTGSEKIKGLKLDMLSMITQRPFPLSKRIDLQTESFRKMHKLQILQLYSTNVQGDYENLPRSLVLLCWHGFPSRCIPKNFHLEEIVFLDLSHSDIISVWDGTMVLPKLKFLFLFNCRELSSTPNFGETPCVEVLDFTGCTKIIGVDESIKCLKRLWALVLKDCSSLKRLPKNLSMVESIEYIDLSGCSSLEELPAYLGKMKSLTEFRANEIALKQSLSSTTSNTRTMILSLLSSASCHPTIQSWLAVRKGPCYTNFSWASLPRSLYFLSLQDCNLYDDAFPRDLNILGPVKILLLDGNPFHRLPESVTSLIRLEYLSLERCSGIISLQKLPVNLKRLNINNCSSLERIGSSQVISRLSNISAINCNKLVEYGSLFKIYSIDHIDKAILRSLGFSNLNNLANIEVDMFNGLTKTRQNTSLQVLFEPGIHSIFLPRDDVPYYYSHQAVGCRIQLEVPPVAGHKLCHLNLCISYGLQHDPPCLPRCPLTVEILNRTSNVKRFYSPIYFAIPRGEGNIQWLSHWELGNHVEAGDELDISAYSLPNLFHINKCGVSFV